MTMEAGVSLVWVIHPRLERFYVCDSVTTPRVLIRGGGAVLPGFELPLAEFFESLPPS